MEELSVRTRGQGEDHRRGSWQIVLLEAVNKLWVRWQARHCGGALGRGAGRSSERSKVVGPEPLQNEEIKTRPYHVGGARTPRRGIGRKSSCLKVSGPEPFQNDKIRARPRDFRGVRTPGRGFTFEGFRVRVHSKLQDQDKISSCWMGPAPVAPGVTLRF